MKYFTFQEMEHSDTATRYAIDNTIPYNLKNNVASLIDHVLDPLREAWGRPLTVTSGYRSPALNKAVGGAATSHHMRGMAADITTGNKVDNRSLFRLILDLNLPFTQLIDEKGFSWVHVSYDPNDLKRQVLKL